MICILVTMQRINGGFALLISFSPLESLRTSYSYRELFKSGITFAIREFYSLIALIDVLQAIQCVTLILIIYM